jgi:maleate cis-trans isomerase
MSAKPPSVAGRVCHICRCKPVVTSSQAALRRLLRLAGVDTLIDGFGRLMQEF